MGKLERIHSVSGLTAAFQRITDGFQGLAQHDGNYIDPEVYPHIAAAREEETIKRVQDFLSLPENQGKQAAVIFGALHDFIKFEPCGLKRENEVLPDLAGIDL
jgi:hypothetical protein